VKHCVFTAISSLERFEGVVTGTVNLAEIKEGAG
jgi:hypothetical protein